MTILSDRLLLLKAEKGLLQKDIALALNLSLRSYQRYETGERDPNASVIKDMAIYFDVSTDYLLGLSDDPQRR